MAENFRAHWIRNIERNARVKVRIGHRRFDATARVLDERKDVDLYSAVCDLMREKHQWDDGLSVEITPAHD